MTRSVGKLVMLALVAGILIAHSPSASAKGVGVDHVVITGPGLSEPIRLDGTDAYRTWFSHHATIGVSDGGSILPEELGPRYRAIWTGPPCDPGEQPPTIVQDVYPYAQPWPTVHSERGSGCLAGFRARWELKTHLFVKRLQEAGVPELSELVVSDVAVGARLDASSATGRRWFQGAIGIALALTALAISVTWRRRSVIRGARQLARPGRMR